MDLKTVLIDFGGMSHASFFIANGQRDMTQEEKYVFWRFLILNQIRKIKNKFKPDELILACDKFSWRKQYFKFYKASRKVNRDKSKLNWEMFYENVNDFLNEMREYFLAYKVIEVNKAEADDIIAIITHGIRSIRKEIIIISSDHDFKQLLSDNVKMYDPRKEKFITCENPKEFLLNHILKGDPGDGIPNIRSDGDTFIDSSKRQLALGPMTITKVLISGLQEFIEENNLQDNYDRNRKLIELSKEMIPKEIQKDIYNEYKSCYKGKNEFAKIQKYLAKNRFRSLLDKIDSFI